MSQVKTTATRQMTIPTTNLDSDSDSQDEEEYDDISEDEVKMDVDESLHDRSYTSWR